MRQYAVARLGCSARGQREEDRSEHFIARRVRNQDLWRCEIVREENKDKMAILRRMRKRMSICQTIQAPSALRNRSVEAPLRRYLYVTRGLAKA